jgi:L-asparagine transporter-like permease
MQALAERGMAPKFLAYVDSKGRPIWGIVVQLCFGLLAFVGESNQEGTVFNWLLALSGLSNFFVWASINLAHIRFRAAWKAQGHIKAELPYEAMFGVVGSWYGLILNIICLIATFYVALFVSPSTMPPSKKLLLTLRTAHWRKSECRRFLLLLPRCPYRYGTLHWVEALHSRFQDVGSSIDDGYHFLPPFSGT